MTQIEKVNMLKDTITFLYEKEGRSKKYISDLLQVNRKTLAEFIEEWCLVKADERHLTPSSQKFLNKNKRRIVDMLNSDLSITDIAKALNVERRSLVRTYIQNDKELLHYYNLYKKRLGDATRARKQAAMDASSRVYMHDEDSEEWRDVLGYKGYQVSNKGRVRKYAARYNSYYLISLQKNIRNGRIFATLQIDSKKANLNVARLVAHTFVDGYSAERNTVDHLDGNVENNRAENLEWVSQGENNRRIYKDGKAGHRAYSKSGKFKKIVLDDKYEFKTLVALAKFLHVSETQLGRYISGECKSNHKFKFVY